jgi:polygalacturonase
VTDITFSDSTISNSQNGCRIKTNSGTTGAVSYSLALLFPYPANTMKISGIIYENIALSGITVYGIDVQQDYLNGGPTGTPTNGVTIAGLTFSNITGTATSTGEDYYILCGSGSCSDFTFSDVSITGGGVASSCNYPSTGCP